MRWRHVVLGALLALCWSGCAPATPEGSSEPLLTLVAIDPSPDDPVSPHTVLTARLAYSTGEFSPGECFISAQFDTLRPGLTSAASEMDPLHNPALTASSGEAVVSEDLWLVTQNPQIDRPLRLRYYLHRRLEEDQSTVIAETPVLTYRLASEP